MKSTANAQAVLDHEWFSAEERCAIRCFLEVSPMSITDQVGVEVVPLPWTAMSGPARQGTHSLILRSYGAYYDANSACLFKNVADLFAVGCDVVTMPEGILAAMLRHPLTDAGLKKFSEDWKTVPHG